jgi:hypothetical protein
LPCIAIVSRVIRRMLGLRPLRAMLLTSRRLRRLAVYGQALQDESRASVGGGSGVLCEAGAGTSRRAPVGVGSVDGWS